MMLIRSLTNKYLIPSLIPNSNINIKNFILRISIKSLTKNKYLTWLYSTKPWNRKKWNIYYNNRTHPSNKVKAVSRFINITKKKNYKKMKKNPDILAKIWEKIAKINKNLNLICLSWQLAKEMCVYRSRKLYLKPSSSLHDFHLKVSNIVNINNEKKIYLSKK